MQGNGNLGHILNGCAAYAVGCEGFAAVDQVFTIAGCVAYVRHCESKAVLPTFAIIFLPMVIQAISYMIVQLMLLFVQVLLLLIRYLLLLVVQLM